MVLLAWGVGTFAGAWVCARIAGRSHLLHGAIIGGYAGGRLAAPRADSWHSALTSKA